MTKKDFILLADRLRGLAIPPDVLEAICNYCQEQNALFKRDLWLRYLRGECGPGGGKLKP